MHKVFGSIITVFLMILAAPVSSQTTTNLTGKIYDEATGAVLPGANIYIEELGRGASSDGDGEYSFSNIPAGRYTISASYIGYRVVKKKFKLQAEGKNVLAFLLPPMIFEGQSVEVTATRASEGSTPVAFSNITAEQLRENYSVSDVPMLLNELPNTYSYSLTGDNIGYSFLKIRGFDQKRVGVMINDIPLNDPEDHQVYWVDLPDLAESVQDIQVQRGVGSTVYGTSTFGGSVNIRTENFAARRENKLTFGGGSFNTRKALAEYRSGMIENSYAVYGRFSKILSDGYRRNSASELEAWHIGAERYDANMLTRINIFTGHEITHPDWDGVPEEILASDRRYKYETYRNAVDNFTQSHYQLFNEWQIIDEIKFTNSLYYVRGEGYYENLKDARNLREYGMDNFTTRDPGLFGADSLSYYETDDAGNLLTDAQGNYMVKRTDLVRQKWVRKNQYGLISKIHYDDEDVHATLGVSGYLFDSRHNGLVTWAKNMPAQYTANRDYYRYRGDRKYGALFFNYISEIYDNTEMMTNFLYEFKQNDFRQQATALFSGEELNRYRNTYNFVSPRMGVTYHLSGDLSMYGNISFAQREPSDDDLYDTWLGPDELGVDPLFSKADTVRSGGVVQYVNWEDPLIEPETVMNYELGVNYFGKSFTVKANFYYMDFRNEIVPLGTIGKDGYPVKGNAESTVHTGIELSAAARPLDFLDISASLAYSKNYFRAFEQKEIIDWDTYEWTTVDLSGNTIAGFPTLLGSMRVTGRWQAFTASLFTRYVGKQYLDNTQDDQRVIDPFTVADLTLSYDWKKLWIFPGLRAQLTVNNVLDTEYETAGYWYYGAYYWPGAPRNFYFALSFNL
jgi:iron complex outermembrane receptor protein